MAVNTKKIDSVDEKLDRALRPQCFDDYIGQKDFVQRMKLAIKAAKERKEPLGHVLLSGSAGLGKTSLANIIANEYGCNFKAINAPAIKSIGDLIETVTKAGECGIVFIDEIHALNKGIQESLLTCLEDFKLSIKLANKQILNMDVAPFCMIGATTELGKLAAPFRDRFDIIYNFEFYHTAELAVIVHANINKLGLKLTEESAIMNIARRSRGVPRLANRLIRRIRDYAQIYNNNEINQETVNKAMAVEGIDEAGLTESDKSYMYTLYHTFGAGPVGKEAIASAIGEDETTVEDFIESYLVRSKFVARTKQGRILTPEGINYVIDEL